jgi:hypothetical protein
MGGELERAVASDAQASYRQSHPFAPRRELCAISAVPSKGLGAATWIQGRGTRVVRRSTTGWFKDWL